MLCIVLHAKNYLWGVFKRGKDEAKDKDVLVEQQDSSVCPKEGETQEHHFHDGSIVKHACACLRLNHSCVMTLWLWNYWELPWRSCSLAHNREQRWNPSEFVVHVQRILLRVVMYCFLRS